MGDGKDERSIEDQLSDARASGYDKGFREGSEYTTKNTREEVLNTIQKVGQLEGSAEIQTMVNTLRVVWGLV